MNRPTQPSTRPLSAASLRQLAALLAVLSGAAVATDASHTAPTPAGPASTPPRSVAQVVTGIMGYTRWPGDAPAVRLCTIGQGEGVDELLRSAELKAGQRVVSVRAANGQPQPWRQCDALYLGEVDADTARALLQDLVGRPVLVLGEGATFCTDGGMFCLEPRSASVRFHANLDAIARSGLRVNPLVLRIARANGGGS